MRNTILKLIFVSLITLFTSAQISDVKVTRANSIGINPYPGATSELEIDDQIKYFSGHYKVSKTYSAIAKSQAEIIAYDLAKQLLRQQEDKDVQTSSFKCSDGFEQLPGLEKTQTHIETSIKSLCNKYQTLNDTEKKASDAAIKTYQILHKMIGKQKAQKAIKAGTDEYFDQVADAETMQESSKDLINNQSKSESQNKSEDKKTEITDNKTRDSNEQNKADGDCSIYDQTCKSSPPFPSQGDVELGINCDDIFKSEGSTWNRRYSFKCSNNKVKLLSKNYQWVKRAPCLMKNQQTGELEKKSNGDVWMIKKSYSNSKEIKGFDVYACVGDIYVMVSSIPFKPKKCKDANKKNGQSWWKVGAIEDYKCKSLLCMKKNESIGKTQRYVEYAWTCTNNNIMPTKVTKDNKKELGVASGARVQKFGSRLFTQSTRPGKYKGTPCYESLGTKYVHKSSCTKDSDSFSSCPAEYPVEMSNEEFWSVNDMKYGIDAKRCYPGEFKVTNKSQCESQDTYKKCVTSCRKKCENPSDYYQKRFPGTPPAQSPEGKYYPELTGVETF